MNGEHRHFFYGYNNNNGPYTGDVDGVDTESNSHLNAVDRFNTSAAGNHNHTFNTNHTGAHAHSFSTNTVGSGKSFNNMLRILLCLSGSGRHRGGSICIY